MTTHTVNQTYTDSGYYGLLAWLGRIWILLLRQSYEGAEIVTGGTRGMKDSYLDGPYDLS